MKKPKYFAPFLLFLLSLAGLYLLLKNGEIPDDPDYEDGEPDGEIDPELLEAKAGDLLLFNRAKDTNQLITRFTQSPFYHVGIALGEGKVIEARLRGVVIRDLAGNDGDRRFEIIPLSQIGKAEDAEKAIAWAKAQLGDGYDPVNVLAIVLNRCLESFSYNPSIPDRWTCGEFVATAFLQAGNDLFPGRDPENIIPGDYAQFLPEPAPSPQR